MKLKLLSLTSTAIVSATCLSASPACAQAAAPQQAEAPSDGADIVVTAQKREERLSTVPVAVTAITNIQLTNSGVVTSRDLVGRVPGLQVGGGLGSGSFVVRGINTGLDSSPTVGTQIDGAPIGAITATSGGASLLPQIDPSTLSRVEVLRGPQGTAYAGSTLGGIVNYVTTTPSLTTLGGSAYLEGSGTKGGKGNFTGRAMVTAPLVTDTLGVQLSGFVNRQSGFIDATAVGRNNYNFNHSYGGRAALLWQVTPNFQVQLSDIYSNVKSYSDVVNADPATSALLGPDLTYGKTVLPRFENEFNIVQLNANLDLDWAKLSYVGTLQHSNAFFTFNLGGGIIQTLSAFVFPAIGGVPVAPTDPLGVSTPQSFNKTTHELRLTSKDEGSLRWIVGAFYSHERDSFLQDSGVFGPAQDRLPTPNGSLIRFQKVSHLKEYAGFADLTYYITPKLDLTGGIRVGRIEQDYRQLFGGADAGAYNAFFIANKLGSIPPDSGLNTTSEGVTTYLANLRYSFTPGSIAYFRFSTGYRPGGANTNTLGLPATYKPDKTDNYELGLKSSFLGGRGYFEIAAYDIEWKNVQILTQGAGGTTGTVNANRAYSRGVEASLSLKPVHGLTLAGSLAYNHARFRDAAAGIAAAGDTLPNTPEWSGSVSADYAFPLSATLEGFVGGQLRFSGERLSAPNSAAVFPSYKLPSYTLGDLRAGVRYGKYELSVFARNIGDERAQIGALFQQGSTYTILQRPRTFGASLSAQF
jgi:outer membrane receptor protein involved in Fe transport